MERPPAPPPCRGLGAATCKGQYATHLVARDAHAWQLAALRSERSSSGMGAHVDLSTRAYTLDFPSNSADDAEANYTIHVSQRIGCAEHTAKRHSRPHWFSSTLQLGSGRNVDRRPIGPAQLSIAVRIAHCMGTILRSVTFIPV